MQTEFEFIKVPYTTSPAMYKNTGEAFVQHVNHQIIQQKQTELNKYGSDLFGQIDGCEAIIERAAKLCNVYTDNILDFALMMEEDIAVMHKGNLAAICFCFPSGFIPSERVGLSLEQVHAPVADGDGLRRASPGIARVMTEKPSFKRHVWTVTVNPELSNHPKNKKDTIPNSIDDLYFRTEYQTTLRVDSDTSLFFVRVNVVPLKSVYDKKILDSINSMSSAVLEYKNLTYIKNLLNSIDDK